MISSRLTLSALPVVRFACSLGTAAHRLQDAVWCQAQVVYCKPLEKPRFAVGLELFTRVERWAKPPRRQGASVSRIRLEPIATVLLLQSCFRLQQAGCVSRDPPRNYRLLPLLWFMLHCGHFQRRKLLCSGKISARYMSAPSWGHRTLGVISLISISVLVGDEVSVRSMVADQAIGVRTGVGKYLRPLAAGLQDDLTKPHLNVMLVAKCGKVPFHLETGHTTSLKTAERQLLRECLN